ncbi:MAG: helix-turn-helix domain-containing protein [Psychrosphaera sp.]|nr:helix-turn-helix domain-containing protein [Psychrosphaera sp.]
MQITSPQMLANILREQRKQQKLSQNDAAASVGIKQTTISAFENAPNGTRLETLFKLLAALDLELAINPRTAKALDSAAPDNQWQEEW